MPSSFTIPKQPKDSNWCWAAVGASVNKYFKPKSTLKECDLAELILNDPGTCNPQPSGLGKTAHLENVLRHLKMLDEPPQVGIALCFDDIRTQINASLPVCVRIGWLDQESGHFVIIHGFAISVSEGHKEYWVDIADPLFEDSTMPYDDFVKAYQGVGQWTDTFLVHPPPKE